MTDQTHPVSPAVKARESIRFRSAEDGDTEALVSLWEVCGLTRAWNDPRKDIEFARTGTTSDVLVGLAGDEIVASVMVGHDGHRGAVYYVSVSPQRRGLGLGREVMEVAHDWLRARGVWKLNLLVRKTNTGVIGFYEELGYKDSETMSLQKVL